MNHSSNPRRALKTRNCKLRNAPSLDILHRRHQVSEHLTSRLVPRSDFTPNSAHHMLRTSTKPSTNASIDRCYAPLPAYYPNTHLVTEIQGQLIVYDLAQSPDQDPKTVIDLLKCSKSKRGNWMIAGAYFRRIGKPGSAIDVLYAMLEMMGRPDFAPTNLNAIFLLLAACELDLALHAHNALDLETHEKHHNNAKSWLRRVYGKDSPTIKTPLPNALLSSRVQSNKILPLLPHPRPKTSRSHRHNPMTTAGRKSKVDGDRRPTTTTGRS